MIWQQYPKSFFPLFFADDTNVFMNGPNIDILVSKINNELSKLVTWLQTNRLSLNISKIHFMIFKTNKKLVNRSLIPLSINSEKIEEATHTKFFGSCS